jgi:hypothetical protein
MADVQTILDKLDGMSRLIRVGDRVGGGTDPHDYSSLEGIARQVAPLDRLVRQLYYGDRVGGTADTLDALSVEGLHRRVEGLQRDVDFLKAAVEPLRKPQARRYPERPPGGPPRASSLSRRPPSDLHLVTCPAD